MIRLAEKSDIDALLPLIKGYWRYENFETFDTARLRRNLDWLFDHPDMGHIHLAIEEDHLVGYLLLVYTFSLEHAGLMADIDEFFIEDAYRGRKIGGRLLAAAETTARKAECGSLMLQVSHHNRRAHDFYVRHGFYDRIGFELLEKEL